jgi:hypothetical protein
LITPTDHTAVRERTVLEGVLPGKKAPTGVLAANDGPAVIVDAGSIADQK